MGRHRPPRGRQSGGISPRFVALRVHTTGIFVRRTLEHFDLPEACLGPPVRDVML